ncbi:hypothetical protein SDC9_111680 [bioreactor metagenome]|uniref:Uncharacterized protein n=1 Tax=bioreactor metagenome TaxID=1076179 RepID=A0A645BJS0_9ZZZZ
MANAETIVALKALLWDLQYTSWITEELFSFQWWFNIIFLVAIYTVWWKLVDKSRLIELLLFGSLLAVMAAIVDTVADNLRFWHYAVRTLPFSPSFFPFHFSIVPLIFMIVYQRTHNWYQYLLVTLFASMIYSFIIAPLFVAVGTMQLLNWNHGYTFISVVARAIFARGVLVLCAHIQGSYQQQSFSFKRFTPNYQPAQKPLPNTKVDKEDRENN